MSIENIGFTWTIQASADLNKLTAGIGQLYKAVGNTGNIVANAASAIGLLQYGADNGGNVSLNIFGISKFVAGAAVAAMTALTVTTSGYLTTAGSGDGIVGKTLVTAVASGEVGYGFFDFSSNEKFDSSSSHIATVELTSFTAQANLSAAASANKFINVQSGDFSASGADAGTVLISGTTSGGTSYGRSYGIVPVKAGGVVAMGHSITSAASGWAISADSGSVILGKALQASAAGNSGQTFNALINLANAHYATSSLDVQY